LQIEVAVHVNNGTQASRENGMENRGGGVRGLRILLTTPFKNTLHALLLRATNKVLESLENRQDKRFQAL
jgi:hypothetical protein